MEIELQVLREFQALSRPHIFPIGYPTATHDIFVLRPGWMKAGPAHIEIFMNYQGQLSDDWLAVGIGLKLDGNPIRGLQPATFWLQPSDTPSGLVHFQPVAGPDNAGLGGWHTVTIRTVL